MKNLVLTLLALFLSPFFLLAAVIMYGVLLSLLLTYAFPISILLITVYGLIAILENYDDGSNLQER